ncbi:hypothetical protein [Methyloglobulus sp.]|uniref:hypothetical protein n=1 Tax=Methyloglobulus sp. TaxID=2518622 RepID=UPI0032B7935F
MKYLLLVLSLTLVGLSFQASAATKDLGMIVDNENFGNKSVVTGFSDTFTFMVSDNIETTISLTNSFSGPGKDGFIKGFSAKLNGVSFDLTANKSSQLLEAAFKDLVANSSYSLLVTGTDVLGTSGSYGGSFQLSINNTANTPIPAAIWLFGSALLGLTGLKRHQAARLNLV